jgi:GTP:adenosylcobinamide-phosphate guanylyltransferase
MIKLGNKRMIEYMIENLINTKRFLKIVICSSKNTVRTKSFLLKKTKRKIIDDLEFVETDGDSYSLDLISILKKFPNDMIFVVSADLPLLSKDEINEILKSCDFRSPCNSIIIEKEFVEGLGIKPSVSFTYEYKEYCYSGIKSLTQVKYMTLEHEIQRFIVLNQKGIAVNVNEKSDLAKAKRMLKHEIF